MDLYTEIINIFNERKFIRAETILPTYISSMGCHMFNFMNKHKEIYWDGDQIADMRLHIFMVTLPGFGKTYTINQFMGKYNGLLKDSAIPTAKVGALTSAGLVGSIKSTPDGNTVVTQGVLQKQADAILGSDEFSNITTSAKTSHSGNLINDLLTAFDDGDMHKDQSGGGLGYETFATMWAATQPGRYELSAGLPRRFCFVIYMPNVGDIFRFRKIRQESKNVRVDIKRILTFKSELKNKRNEINTNLKRIEYPDEWYKWLHSHFALHTEDILYERIILGYWLMKLETIPETLVLNLNDEVKGIIEQQMAARMQVNEGVQKIKIMEALKFVKTMPYVELMKMLLTFGLPQKYIETNLQILVANKFITIDKKTGVVTNLRYDGEEK